MSLPPELRRIKNEIRAYAVEFGLDFYETIFEVVDADRGQHDRQPTAAFRRAIRTGASAWSTSS
jgi:hypothetical protein